MTSIKGCFHPFLKCSKDGNTSHISHILSVLCSVAGLEWSELGIFCFVALLAGWVGNTNIGISLNAAISFLVSPEPKTEMKTLKWAISQFASVERIVGEDKYFCENCHHYTEAERSLLFDKMPEVITIHLKCFAASGLEWVCIACLTKQGPAAREVLPQELEMLWNISRRFPDWDEAPNAIKAL